MEKRGSKPKGRVRIRWSTNFAYAIGLLATDGNLSSNGRHISLVSNDLEQIENFKKCLNLNNKISMHRSGSSGKNAFRIQFGDVLFYAFLNRIGLTSKKSLTIGKVDIPAKYYFDFLRGHFDGDGSFYSYYDKRWKSSFMYYVYFYSASKKHLDWLRAQNRKYLGIIGHSTKAKSDSTHSLRYAKKETVILLRAMYKNKKPSLKRKYLKIKRVLGILGTSI